MTPQTRLDLLADDILERLTPLTFDAARTAEEIDAVLRMRYDSVVEEGWGRPEDFPDRRERDAHDARATHLICRDGPDGSAKLGVKDGAQIVGSARLVPPAPGSPTLLEQEFGVALEPSDRVIESGRLVVPHRHRRGRSHLIMTGLFARAWLMARELGFDRVVGQANTPLIELYRGLGLRVEVLGPSRPYFGDERFPIEVVGPEIGLG